MPADRKLEWRLGSVLCAFPRQAGNGLLCRNDLEGCYGKALSDGQDTGYIYAQ